MLDLNRRKIIKGGLGCVAAAILGCSEYTNRKNLTRDPPPPTLPFNFAGVPISTDDTVNVPEGYVAELLIAWGDPVSTGPVFKRDATNDAADQALQCGMHSDGMEYFSLSQQGQTRQYALLCINNEYIDEGLLHADGFENWSLEKVRKSQAAVGVTIICVVNDGGRWDVVRPSSYARRITVNTPIRISGPAAGDPAMMTNQDPSGTEVLGTLANCASGRTPWDTYLTCEENWHGYFAHTRATRSADPIPPEYKRYKVGLPKFGLFGGLKQYGFGSRWHEYDRRFDTAIEPHEPNRFGWVVEIDPYDPDSTPIKRTALGRFKHESATVTLSRNNRVVVYMGDDEKFEYIYKFVSHDKFDPDSSGLNRDLLDRGTLYVAQYSDDGNGIWLPLVHGQLGLVARNGFRNQAEVLIKTRQAADHVGATKMDRPEWIAVNPRTQKVFCSLTNNEDRGDEFKVNAANPRKENIYGHILEWTESEDDAAATQFQWRIFTLCGDTDRSQGRNRSEIYGDIFCCPDGLRFDDRGWLWIATDLSAKRLNQRDFEQFGNNQLLVADAKSGYIKRFLTGPKGCEVTGIQLAPDLKTLFVNIQHPGEIGGDRNNPEAPRAVSAWPDGHNGGRPRSATLAIRKIDGGFIGE